MATKRFFHDPNTATVVGVLYNEDGEIWNTNTSAFEARNLSNVAHYDITTTLSGSRHMLTIPAGIATAMVLNLVWCAMAGAALTQAELDDPLGDEYVPWDGEKIIEQTGDSFARLGDPAGASHAVDVAAIKAKTDLIGTAAASPLVLRTGTAQAGASTTITLDAGASATTDFYVNCPILITGGTGAGQANWVKSYNGTTKVATLALPWITNPDATSTFVLEYPTNGVLRELLIADRTIDTATTPWSVVMKKHAASHELFRQRLFDVNGTNLLSEQTVPGRSIE